MTIEKIEYTFSPQDITSICRLLNGLLKNITLIPLTRCEVEMADPQKRIYGSGGNEYSDIVKVVNRWGLKDKTGEYNRLLNGVIGKITSCCRMLIIYEPIQLLLFNKLLEEWSKGVKAKFNKEEIEIFFLQPFNMIVSSCLPESSIYLNNLLIESQKVSEKLKSKDSKEFLGQGVGRRLSMLKENVDSISKIYNKSRIKTLDENENTILSQNINFFYANIYAILDCLAFILAFENPGYKIDRGNSNELKKVGLFKKSFYTKINGLCEKLSLTKLKHWYTEIQDLRHPIAHRIPLYFQEIYKEEEARKIKEIRDEYSKNFNTILGKMMKLSNSENNQINERMDMAVKLSDSMDKLRAERQTAESNVIVFSGCFIHSEEESKKHYHLSRITLDLGILYHLLDNTLEYICDNFFAPQ